MLDREKVLQALQHCPDDCSDCYTGGPGFGIACRDQLRRDAIALLKEQAETELCDRCGRRRLKSERVRRRNGMTHKEHVIKALEEAIPFIDSRGYGGVAEIMHDALALLKEQEAVKPRVSTVEQRCGNCNKVIEMDGWKACPWCGKPILWEAVGRSVK